MISSISGNGIGGKKKKEKGEGEKSCALSAGCDLKHPFSWDYDTERDKFTPALSCQPAHCLRWSQFSKIHQAEDKTGSAGGRTALFFSLCSLNSLLAGRCELCLE